MCERGNCQDKGNSVTCRVVWEIVGNDAGEVGKID